MRNSKWRWSDQETDLGDFIWRISGHATLGGDPRNEVQNFLERLQLILEDPKAFQVQAGLEESDVYGSILLLHKAILDKQKTMDG